MNRSIDIGIKVGSRIVVSIIILAVLVGFHGVVSETKTGYDLASEKITIAEEETAIKYEELSEIQQDQFRSAVAADSYIKVNTNSLEQYEYIYLDGTYYELRSINYNTDLQMALFPFSILAGASFCILVVLVIGGLIAFLLSLKGVTGKQFVKKYADMKSNENLISGLLVAVILLSLIAPPVFSVQSMSTEQVSKTDISKDNVILAETLSEKQKTTFYDAVDGQNVFTTNFEKDSVIKSDGEYYTLSFRYPLLLTFKAIIIGIFCLFFWGYILAEMLAKRVWSDLEGDTLNKKMYDEI